MNFLANPVTIRIALVFGVFFFAFCIIAFSFGIVRYRQNLQKERAGFNEGGSFFSNDSLALSTLQQAISDLKKRQIELEDISRKEAKRADSATALCRAVLDNLSVPALTCNEVGIVQLANPPARTLFGYASLAGFDLKALFGQALIQSGELPPVFVSEVIRKALRGDSPIKELYIECKTRTQTDLKLSVTVVPGQQGSGVLLMPLVDSRGKGACTDEVPPPA